MSCVVGRISGRIGGPGQAGGTVLTIHAGLESSHSIPGDVLIHYYVGYWASNLPFVTE